MTEIYLFEKLAGGSRLFATRSMFRFMIDLSHLMLMAFCQARYQEMLKSLMKAQQEQYIIIKFLSIEGRTANEIRIWLLSLYGKAIYAPATIYKWIRKFRTRRTSIFDKLHSRRPLIDHIKIDILCNVIVAKLLKALWHSMGIPRRK
jgi:hypothetical protein